MTRISATRSAPVKASNPIRAMVVDDSAVIRGTIARWLETDPEIEVVARHANGKFAVRDAVKSGAEIVILDIEMPEMDGLTALPLILKAAPDIKVIMASTLTRRNADISLQALSMGAADYLAKPEALRGQDEAQEFQRQLIEKVKAITGAARRRSGGSAARPAPGGKSKAAPKKPISLLSPQGPIKLIARSKVMPTVLAVGSSTGGPEALLKFFTALAKSVGKVPVVVAQHMPATFTAILAEHIEKATGIPCAEGKDGEALLPGKIYIAPGDFHMKVISAGGKNIIRIDDGPRINFCRPAVDVLFDSVAKAYGAGTLSVVLTGMGHDGRDGGKTIVEAGGSVIAQDEESSVVWGMPGSVAAAGICCAIRPLNELGLTVSNVLQGKSL